MAETRVYLLDGGSLVIDGFHIFWNRGPAGEVRIPCYNVLVEHEEGRLLFETGFDLDHTNAVLPFEKPLQTPEQTVPGQLARVGLQPGDITFVVNSHLHFDHCGGNKQLPDAQVVCHELELEAARHPEPFEMLGYSDMGFAPGLREDAPADAGDYHPEFRTITGDVELLPGVRLFETPGHTVGHYSMMVELEGRRPMLFTGDACYGPESLELNCIASFHRDPSAGVRSLQRLRDLSAEHDAELFFSHDQASWESYVKAPDFYA